eukprot:3107912-Rhodomonas_salina.1
MGSRSVIALSAIRKRNAFMEKTRHRANFVRGVSTAKQKKHASVATGVHCALTLGGAANVSFKPCMHVHAATDAEPATSVDSCNGQSTGADLFSGHAAWHGGLGVYACATDHTITAIQSLRESDPIPAYALSGQLVHSVFPIVSLYEFCGHSVQLLEDKGSAVPLPVEHTQLAASADAMFSVEVSGGHCVHPSKPPGP